MADLNKQALEMWNSMKPMIDREIEQQTKGTVQRRKAKVTTAPSLVTKKIGVTEPFGDQYFIPYDAKVAGANVGDVVWVEYMYGASNAFASMFAKAVEDPRSCSATLSSAGWYRVLHVANPTGSISRVIDLTITRNYANVNNESHCIKYIGNYNSHSFNDEVSKSNTILVDKVRYTTDSNYGYVDIHYAGTYANKIAVDFECYADIGLKQSCVAESLQSVADAPSGETVLTTYTFYANYNPTMVDIWSAVTLNYSELRKYVRIQGGMVHILIETYFDSYQADYEYTLGSVSSPYRPLYPVFFTGHTVDANFNPKGLVTFIIYPDGTMTVRINNTNGNYLILNATYPIF